MSRERERDTRVIGYFACLPPTEVFCEADACVIAGSKEVMLEYLAAMSPNAADRLRIMKTRFGEILQGLRVGGSYALDEQAYNRFYPLAEKAGLDFGPQDFSGPTPTGFHFIRVQLSTAT